MKIPQVFTLILLNSYFIYLIKRILYHMIYNGFACMSKWLIA